jgi:hypothetical protein
LLSVILMAVCIPACMDTNHATHPILNNWETDAGHSADASIDPGADEPEPLAEICDGVDNDSDGEIDEGTGGEACQAPGGDQGTRSCVQGELICVVCQPGEIRETPCNCEITRVDICGPDGTWRLGACDPCEDPEPPPCGFCGQLDMEGTCVDGGECQPEDVMYRRCDDCPEGTGCGQATCVGEKWECGQDCMWHKLQGCAIRPSECDRDTRLLVPCGQCGQQTLECDGCFFNRSDCREHGSCFPGATTLTPCFDRACEEGFGETFTCSDDCEWEGAMCQGCAPGTYSEKVDCVHGHPLCGQRDYVWECVLALPESECLPAIGEEVNHHYVGECPPTVCYPGQRRTQACWLDNGMGGESVSTCRNDCTWSDYGPCHGGNNSCIPGEQTVTDTNCGCGVVYQTIKTCQADGMGWDTQVVGMENCPECQPGSSYTQSCTSSGTCGTQTVSCNQDCEWTTSQCNPQPGGCVNGSTESRSCTATCGPGHATYTCYNCSWVQTGTCVEDNPGQCTPGDTRTVQCNPEGCPQRQDTCNTSCVWVEGNCPPCG